MRPCPLSRLWWLTAICVLSLLPVASATSPAPAGRLPRIGVGGVWPTGYLGVLARYGLPGEMVLDYQLADPEALARYDLLIISGSPPAIGASCRPALERVLAREGAPPA